MSNGTKVVKRNGKTEPLDLNKLHVMVEEACKDLANVSASQVEMQSGIQFYDGITTAEIQEILIRSASDLIDLDHPNYQFVAARLLLFALRKQLFGRMHECPTVKQHVERCVGRGVYDSEILTMYSDEEFDKLESFVDHSRDYLFTYAGLRQVVDKYLVQDRSTGALYETPQFMYLLIAATIFSKYPKETRLDYVKRYYECFYTDKYNYPNYYTSRVLIPLTPKEKDRILNIINYFDADKFRTLLDHLEMKKDLNNLGEDVKFKFTNISSFNLEHEEFSRLLQSYRKGEVERHYGDVDSLETPIEHQGETYYPVLLRKTMDYEKESQHQRNCVRGYSERPDCLIFSIRKESTDGDDRITVEYQYRKNEILNVQERARFNETPSLEFSQVAKIQLANINLLYKLGTLKLPKLIKKIS